jgi:hypothetical protein
MIAVALAAAFRIRCAAVHAANSPMVAMTTNREERVCSLIVDSV